MLNLKPYLEEIENIEPGQTLRINHTDCEAGEDTRRRLYLTRTHADECRVIAYCHNCQQGGYHSDGHYKSYRNTKHGQPSNDKVSINDSIDEPVGLIERFVHWPTDAQAWALQRGLSQVDLNWYRISYDPSTDRVYIPRYNSMDRRKDNHGDLVGYQLRSLHGYARPKYMTVQRKDASNWTFIHPDAEECDWAVIVEDMVSAIHILRATAKVWADGGNLPGVFVNYGTRIDPTMMWTIAQNFKWCTVWLDNDNQHVDNQAAMMARTIAMYNDRIKVGREREASDPKHYIDEEICRILDGVHYG